MFTWGFLKMVSEPESYSILSTIKQPQKLTIRHRSYRKYWFNFIGLSKSIHFLIHALWMCKDDCLCTDKKDNKIFLIRKFRMEKLQRLTAPSYMGGGGAISSYMYLYWEALPHIWLCSCSTLNFLIYAKKSRFYFYQCGSFTENPVEIYPGSFHWPQIFPPWWPQAWGNV